MRRIILTVSLAGLGLILWPFPVPGAVMVSPANSTPVRVRAGDPDERPDSTRSPDAGNWLWDLLMDRLTFPLGPADQNIWPLWSWREQWIVTADRGDHWGRASDGQAPTEHGFLPTVGSRILSPVSVARTRTRAAASETGTHTGGHTCNVS
jgi:hypothetical protein